MAFHVPDEYRTRIGLMATSPEDGNNGAFLVPVASRNLTVLASDVEGWEHVSVSTPNRCPNWHEMDTIKRIFWDDEDAVMQLHVPLSEWISNHPYCLHLWRPTDREIPLPPSAMVGVRTTT